MYNTLVNTSIYPSKYRLHKHLLVHVLTSLNKCHGTKWPFNPLGIEMKENTEKLRNLDNIHASLTRYTNQKCISPQYRRVHLEYQPSVLKTVITQLTSVLSAETAEGDPDGENH